MKKYKAILFDWDGTAVVNRTAPADALIPLLTSLLKTGTILIIISGTTYENISGGELHKNIPADLLKNLYLGLGRGAYNFGFSASGELIVLDEVQIDVDARIKIDEVAFRVHTYLLKNYGLQTDIVFSRPNYCKINLLVDHDRKDRFNLSANEIDMVNELLEKHDFQGGLLSLLTKAKEIANSHGLCLEVTTDAKFLEIGTTTKADNVSYFLKTIVYEEGIKAEECAFWGDEFAYLAPGIRGSDAQMLIEEAKGADFFDVSESRLSLPGEVNYVGGGPAAFVDFLNSQIQLAATSDS